MPVLVTIVAGIGIACSREGTGLDDETYVEVMAQVAWAGLRYIDPVEADSARSAVLERFGLTGAELLAFADEHGSDLDRMSRIFDDIRRRVDSLDAVPIPGVGDGQLRLDSLNREPS